MLDIKFIRENAQKVQEAIELKGVDLDLNQLLELDKKVLELKKKIQSLQTQKNSNAKLGKQASSSLKEEWIQQGKSISEQLKKLTPHLDQMTQQLQEGLWLVPNLPAPDAPQGKNVKIREWGQLPQFSFQPLNHIELLQKNQWAELERIAKVCGSRHYSFKGQLVQVEFALIQYAMEKLRNKGFTLLSVPALVQEFALYGSGHFPIAREQNYFLPKDHLYLSGTAEVMVNALHSGEILKEQDLPLLYSAYSPCFRREAGHAGRDVRGLMRVHQFMKLEQFVITKNDPQDSEHWHQKMLSISEEILQELEVPYQLIEICTGDMGLGKVRMHDLECWVPSEGRYCETHSCSTLYDWQARRVNLRYRDQQGKIHFCHTLNNTVIATPRILIPLLENHQQPDGRIRFPKKFVEKYPSIFLEES